MLAIALGIAVAAPGEWSSPALDDTVAAAGTDPLLTPVTPGRVFESRRGPGLGTVDGEQAGEGRRSAGQVTEVQVTGRAGVPEGAIGVAVNVTIIRPDRNGFATVFPCDEPQPGSSTINYSGGQVVANGAIVKLSGDGTVCVFVLRGTDLVVDVTGFANADSPLGIVSPARFYDSRPGEPTVDGAQSGAGRRSSGQVTDVQITGREGIPDDAVAVVVNITAIRPDSQGFVTVFPCGSPQPTASTLNPSAGAVVANGAIVEIGSGGTICVVSNRGFDLAVDVTGFVPQGSGFGTLNPARLFESRPDSDGTIDGKDWIRTRVRAGTVAEVEVPFRPGVPVDIDSATLNVTAIRPAGAGFITVYPCGEDRPNASTLNYQPGQVVANSVIVQPGDLFRVCIFANQEMDLIVDITGYTTASTTAVDFEVGARGACSARSDGSVWCWGQRNPAFVNTPGATSGVGAYPRRVPGISDAVAVTNGNDHACALRSGGSVLCWGENDAGQLGNDAFVDSEQPVTVVGLSDATAIGAGANHTCAVREGGTAVCWGINQNGQLGNGSRLLPPNALVVVGLATPQAVLDLTDVVDIALGDNHTCALRSNGRVSCWGTNFSNVLGLPSGTLFRDEPFEMPGITGATSLSVGNRHNCVSLESGTVRCWGSNSESQLGGGHAVPAAEATPVTATGLTDAVEVAAGRTHSCARRSDGTVWCWGRGAELQLGQGSDRTEQSTPVQVRRITSAVQIDGGEDNTCARASNGRILCWGARIADIAQPTDGEANGVGFGTPVTQVFR